MSCFKRPQCRVWYQVVAGIEPSIMQSACKCSANCATTSGGLIHIDWMADNQIWEKDEIVTEVEIIGHVMFCIHKFDETDGH
jgi:hypothetical protein